MDKKPLPGPWYVGPQMAGYARPVRAVQKGGIQVALVGPGWGGTGDANARLIAAAPDLLEALQSFCRLYESEGGCSILSEYLEAKYAIKKALKEPA